MVGRGLCLQVWHRWVGVVQWWFGLRGWWVGVGRSWLVHEGLELVGWGWSVVVCAFGFGVDGLGLVGRSLRLRVWGWWVEVHLGLELVGRGWHGWVGVGQWWFGLRGWWVGVGRSWFVHEGLGSVGWGWSVVVCAFGFGVDGLGLVGRSVRWRVWGWWVERHLGLELVGRGWSVVVGA